MTPQKAQEEDKSQTIQKYSHLALSSINFSHRNYVADMAFIPGTINVDKKNPSGGVQTHLMTCSEDGLINIWDTRQVDKEFLKNELMKNRHSGKQIDKAWIPLRFEVFKQDGTGELGLSRILLRRNQTDALFWGATDEGDLVQIDWSVRPQ